MLKRIFDVLASLTGIILLSPLFIILIVIIKFSSPGPIFYHATRVGHYGRNFKLFKFRSMVINADKLGPAVTGAKDSRITPIGRFLRKTKLDELPQLLNVLRGEMSIVGPRPEDPRYVALYNEEQRKVLSVRPGITSPATVKYRDEESILIGEQWEKYYIEKVMPLKLAIDLKYIDNPNIINDIGIILETIKAIITGSSQGAA